MILCRFPNPVLKHVHFIYTNLCAKLSEGLDNRANAVSEYIPVCSMMWTLAAALLLFTSSTRIASVSVRRHHTSAPNGSADWTNALLDNMTSLPLGSWFQHLRNHNKDNFTWILKVLKFIFNFFNMYYVHHLSCVTLCWVLTMPH